MPFTAPQLLASLGLVRYQAISKGYHGAVLNLHYNLALRFCIWLVYKIHHKVAVPSSPTSTQILNPDASLEEVLEVLRPRFWKIIMRLIGKKQIPHSSIKYAPDIIQEYFSTIWPNVKRLYKPEKGPLIPFAVIAFKNFAIRSFKQQHKRNQVFTSLEDDLDVASEDVPYSKYGFSIFDHQKLKHALQTLESDDHKIILTYFSQPRPSIRDLSEKENTTRYKAEQTLLHAFTKLLMKMERPATISKYDWKLSRLLLIDEYTVKQVSEHLRITTQKVREIHKRTLDAIKKLLQS